jgi:hypothetical protein
MVVSRAAGSNAGSSTVSIAYWPHFLNKGHFTQSVKTFSLSQRWGTIENPI